MQMKEMSPGDRLILLGNLLGALAVCLTSIGALVRAEELPDKPMFTPRREDPSGSNNVSNTQINYWERGSL